jgi:hypothetical protein
VGSVLGWGVGVEVSGSFSKKGGKGGKGGGNEGKGGQIVFREKGGEKEKGGQM